MRFMISLPLSGCRHTRSARIAREKQLLAIALLEGRAVRRFLLLSLEAPLVDRARAIQRGGARASSGFGSRAARHTASENQAARRVNDFMYSGKTQGKIAASTAIGADFFPIPVKRLRTR